MPKSAPHRSPKPQRVAKYGHKINSPLPIAKPNKIKEGPIDFQMEIGRGKSFLETGSELGIA